jgi:leader peptidase (prepilin peptidase)/N-methyltransferase
MTGVALGFGAVLGAAIGSFVNVLLWRVPRHESVVHPPSHCPSCLAGLGASDLVPVLSWVRLHGRCRSCRVRISIRYPLVEAGFGALGALVAWLAIR